MATLPKAEASRVVLVVDDPRHRRLLEGAPADTGWYSYREAEHPDQAERSLERLRPEAVVIDAHLSENRGIALCTALRGRPGAAALPVILVVNPGDAEMAQRAYDAGAFAVESAPLAWPMFGHRLRHLLRLGRSLRDARHKVSGLETAQRIAKLMSWSWDPAGSAFVRSDELAQFLGLEPGAAAGFESHLERVHPDDRGTVQKTFLDAVGNRRAYSLEYRVRTGAGSFATVLDAAESVLDEYGRSLELAGAMLDVTEWRGTGERAGVPAHLDAATGLPNRELFLDRLGQALAQAKRSDWAVALLILGLDGFKDLNLSLGHSAGDRLLKEVGRRLGECVRQNDTVARLGGDQFALILTGVKTAESASLVAQKALSALKQPVSLDGRDTFTSCCVGIAVYPGDGDTAEALLRHAETAMYRAKDAGRSSVQFYTEGMNTRVAERLEIESGLHQALDRGQFALHYQPMVDLGTGRVAGMEALLRWNHAEKGILAPSHFIPILESSGLIVRVGEWVLRTACEQNLEFRRAGLPPLRIAVNLSMRQFQQPDLVELVSRTLQETGLPPESLELELTESLMMEGTDEAVAKLVRLRDLGVSLSIDDFGTGFSSLSYLSRFPFDTLKIDQTFTRNIATRPSDAAITKGIIALARSLDLRIVVEGVETEAQLRFFRGHLCDEIQGYFCAPPLPGPEFARLLQTGRPFQMPA